MKIAILSFYGRQKRNISSNRIYGLLRGLSKLGAQVYFFTAPTSFAPEECFDLSFCEDVIEFSALPISANLYEFGKNFFRNIVPFHSQHPESSGKKLDKRVALFYSLVDGFRHWRYASPIFRDNVLGRGYLVLESPTVWRLHRCILQNDIHILITSHIPPMAHELGLHLKRRIGPQLYWVADFRDPMIGHEYASVSSSKRLASIQIKTLCLADLVTMVSQSMIREALSFTRKANIEVDPHKFLCLYNGFFEFCNLHPGGANLRNNRLKIAYTGTVFQGKQDLSVFFEALASLSEEALRNIEFIYAGPQADLVRNIAGKYQLQSLCHIVGMVEKETALWLQHTSDILLLLKSDTDRGIFTGKFFEYLPSGKPILVIGNRDEEFNHVALRIGGVKIVPNGPEGSQQIAQILTELLKAPVLQEKILEIFGRRNKEEADKFHWDSLSKCLYERILQDVGSVGHSY